MLPAIYYLLHAVGGLFLIPIATSCFFDRSDQYATEQRMQIPLDTDWKYKRITIEFDGDKIDALIVGKPATLNNGRWLLSSLGNCQFYEDCFSRDDGFRRILHQGKCNGIFFNYPGVGGSSGWPTRKALVNGYRAVLSFLEDPEKGIGAKEIIGFGHSIGGAVQGEALAEHSLRQDIKYVFVKNKTFSDLSSVVSSITNRCLGILTQLLGWNLNPVASSKRLSAPEIVIQTARVRQTTQLGNRQQIVDDGIIPAKDSLAYSLLEDPDCPRENKLFIGVKEGHNEEGNSLPLMLEVVKFLDQSE